MPAAQYHTYVRKVLQACRRADADASPAQREAGNARVGRLFIHGLRVAIEYPKGSVRRGTSKDGKTWSRAVRNSYGYINRVISGDGEHLDVWLGDNPDSQLAFTFEFLTDKGEHDELKAVLGARHLTEAKKIIEDNYPEGFLEDRIGEIRGYFFPDFKKFLKTSGMLKKGLKKQASSDGLDRYACPHCRSTNAFNGNPDTGHKFRVGRCLDCNKFFSIKGLKMQPNEEKSSEERPVRADANHPADCENCPHCDTPMERGDDGYCNCCSKPWPAVTKKADVVSFLLGMAKFSAGPLPGTPAVKVGPVKIPIPIPKPPVAAPDFSKLMARPTIQPKPVDLFTPKTSPQAYAPTVLPSGSKLIPSSVVTPKIPSIPESPAPVPKGVIGKAVDGLKWYGGEMSGVSKADVAANPIRTLGWSAPKNILTTPIYSPLTKERFPTATKWLGRAQNAATYGPMAAGAVAYPWTARSNFVGAADDAADAVSARHEDRAPMRKQLEDDFFSDIAPHLLPQTLGGDPTWVGDTHRRIAKRTGKLRYQDSIYNLNTQGNSMVPAPVRIPVQRTLEAIRSVTPLGAATTAGLHWWGEPKRDEINEIARSELEGRAEELASSPERAQEMLLEARKSPLLKAYQPALQHLAKPRSLAGAAWSLSNQYPEKIPNPEARRSAQYVAGSIYHEKSEPSPGRVAELIVHGAKRPTADLLESQSPSRREPLGFTSARVRNNLRYGEPVDRDVATTVAIEATKGPMKSWYEGLSQEQKNLFWDKIQEADRDQQLRLR